MEVPRWWRGQKTRYGLVGDLCSGCRKPTFPPKDVCEECETKDLPIFKNNRGTIYVADQSITSNIPVQAEKALS